MTSLGFVKELVNAFNVSNYGSRTNTNFVVEGDNIVVKFDCNINSAKRHLSKMKEDLIREIFPDKYVARHFFDLTSFPFNFDEGKWVSSKMETKFTVPINSRVIFNFKMHFAEMCTIRIRARMSMELEEFGLSRKDAGEMIRQGIKARVINSPYPYLHCVLFNSENVQRHFVETLQAQMKEYGYNYLDFYRIDSNEIYLKDVEDIGFVRSVVEVSKEKIGYNFNFSSDYDLKVRKYKDAMGELIFRVTGIPICGYYRDSFICKGRKSDGGRFAFIPMVEEGNSSRYLTYMEADKINAKFSHDILTDVKGQTEATSKDEFIRSGIDRMYAFSDRQIALLIPVIIENSVINKDGQIEIDPGLPRTLFTEASSTKEFPTRSPGEVEKSPRQGSGKKEETGGLLYDQLGGLAGTSGRPSSQVSYPAVNGVSGKCLGAAAVEPSHTSSLGTSGNERPDSAEKWMQSTQPTQSEPIDLSRKGAAQNVPAAQSQDRWSFSPPPPPPPPPPFIPKGPASSPPPLIPSSSNVSGSQPPAQMSSSGASSSKGAQAGANISEKEKKLIEALLYTFNLTNYTLDGVYTNFFAKDGKIISLLHDNVDREKYLQAVRDYIIEEYCEDEEEARELYDLDDLPFKFLPDPDYKKSQNDYEPKEKETVVANISSGALSNLKILFSQKFKKDVDAIDINWVKKVEEREKDKWVDYQLSNGDSLEKACESCFPDEGPMKIIPIALEEDEYVLDRAREFEVELLLREQLRRFRGTLVNEEEKKLFKALLYVFNLNNYTFEYTHTNFIVENGKIASFIDNGVNVKKYLQKLSDSTIENYCVTEKEAYDLNEFPFKFLSNCEKKQKMTVVANISHNALFNLKKLFIQEQEPGKKVKIEGIDINIVEKEVKYKEDLWVNSQVKSGLPPMVARSTRYPKESKLKDIPIVKGKGEDVLLHDYLTKEKKEEPRNATTTFKKIEEDKNVDNSNGYSSGYVTDPEKVNPNDEPMDYQASSWSEDEDSLSESSISGSSNSSPESDGENTRIRLRKRKSQEPVDEGNPTKKSSRSGSSNSSSPRSDLFDSDSELCRSLDKAGISK